jgi:2',3'-cyclic-nucleotide 2'-phosphodiesterase (5'-nucleotidase family)
MGVRAPASSRARRVAPHVPARLFVVAACAAVAMGGALASCGATDGGSMADDGGGTAVAETGADDAGVEVEAAAGEGTLQILALADLRGQLEPVVEADSRSLPQVYGGLEALATYFARERASVVEPTLVVSAGDSFGASPILSSAFYDVPTAKGLDLLGVTASAFGEHDFSRGTKALAALLGMGSFRMVSTNLANVVVELGPEPVTPLMLLDVGGADAGTSARLRVAILGLTRADVRELQFPANLGDISATAPAAAANKTAQHARLLGADVVIALAHVGAAGLGADGVPYGPLLDLAGELRGVDLLVGGESDVALCTAVGAMAVVQPRSKGRSYARVRLAVTGSGVRVDEETLIEPLVIRTSGGTCDAGADSAPCACPAAPCAGGASCNDASLCEERVVEADDAAVALLAPHRAALPAALDRPIAVSDGGFAENGTEQRAETALGDLVADALLAKYATLGKPPQIALVPGARLRAALPSSYVPSVDAGLRRGAPPYDLLVADVQRVLPFGDTAVVRTLTGARLREVLEQSVAAVPAASASFMQVAGLTVTYSRSADAGSRIEKVTVAAPSGGAIDVPPGDATEYLVVLPDWTSRGHDGFAQLAEDVSTPGRDLLADILAEYLASSSPLGAFPARARIVPLP